MNNNIYEECIRQLDAARKKDCAPAKRERVVAYVAHAIRVAEADRTAMEDLARQVKDGLKERTHKRKAYEAAGILDHHAQLILDDVQELIARLYEVDPEFYTCKRQKTRK